LLSLPDRQHRNPTISRLFLDKDLFRRRLFPTLVSCKICFAQGTLLIVFSFILAPGGAPQGYSQSPGQPYAPNNYPHHYQQQQGYPPMPGQPPYNPNYQYQRPPPGQQGAYSYGAYGPPQ